jgi:hypothetical protein
MQRLTIALGLVAVGVMGVGVGLSQTAAKSTDACRFVVPVGANGEGYYDAQPFGANDHLGSDWNSLRGGNRDLGMFVFAAGDGIVTDATDYGGGWGNVVRIQHTCGDRVETLYAHLDTIHTVRGARVARGQLIGTVGTAGGQYLAHLHFEMRDRWMPLGGGYSMDRTGYLDPTEYIRHHR